MLTIAMDFFSRFYDVHESRTNVVIAGFGGGNSLDDVMETLRAAYRLLYGEDRMVAFQRDASVEEIGLRSRYMPLFPKEHLHVAVCVKGLEQLSKVPEKVVENGWNKTKVWIEGADPRVVKAYSEQAEKDLVEFLKHRKEELKIGGSLFMLISGRDSTSQLVANDSRPKHVLHVYMDRAWQALVDQGILEVEKRDRFKEEIEAAIERCGGFRIEDIRKLIIADSMNAELSLPTVWVEEPNSYGQKRAGTAQGAIGEFTEDYLGPLMTDKLFKQYATIAAEDNDSMNKKCFNVMIAVSVTRI